MASHTVDPPVVPASDLTDQGARTTARRLHHFFHDACDRTPWAVALECDEQRLTYADLDARANQVAHYLRRAGVGTGTRVAVLLPRSVGMYVSLLGVCKAGAAFVPLDPASPHERIAYILGDSGADVLLTTGVLMPRTGHAETAEPGACRVIRTDAWAGEVARLPTTRPPADTPGAGRYEDDPTAYIMYTSGSSGRPKGVEIAQSSICNFLGVVTPVYAVRPDDRVFQGMTISFDFSLEEIWPTWTAGATLVAGPSGPAPLGDELADFLETLRVTVLYCVPTLLATIPRELPRIRSIVVGGEACPHSLVDRWSRPGRRILNTYGPTEATVTATWQEMRANRPVTIGRPLPTYSVVLLDGQRRPVPHGSAGEICLGGPGLARGYVGRPDLTADRFIEHPLGPRNGRLYRTGDLGRMTADGEIEYLGRADAEVKIRGYRVALGEIDNVLLEDPGVAQAVTALVPAPDTGRTPRPRDDLDPAGHSGPGSGKVLAAYVVRVTDSPGRDAASDGDLVGRLHEHLQRTLPAYMVPSFLDILDRLPAMPSGKVDRRLLPPPTGRRLMGTGRVVPARGKLERRVRDTWAQVLGLAPDELSAEANFFTDLGGHSLLAAQVVSLLRGRDSGTGPTLRDLYEHPTVQGFAERIRASAATAGTAGPPRSFIRHSRGRIALAGLAQAGAIYVVLLLFTLPVAITYAAHHGQASGGEVVQPTIAAVAGYLAVRWILPPALARLLGKGIAPGHYPLWGRTYLRLWALHLLVEISPLRVLSGSPMAAPYLRLLGARVGARTTIATGMIGLPALLTIGSDAAVGYAVSLRPWKVADGRVTVAPITVGERAFVGANAVLEPGARMGPDSGLGEQSVIGQDESMAAGARWAGSPARRVEALTPVVEAMLRTPGAAHHWRPRHLSAALLGLVFLELAPLLMVLPGIALFWFAWLRWGTGSGLVATALSGPVFVGTVCSVVAVGRRLVRPGVPVGIHSARSSLGVRKWFVDKLLEYSLTFTNALYATLYTVPWLRLLGARVGRGAEVSTAAHVEPGLLTLKERSFVADMASIGSAVFAAGQVAMGPTTVGSRAFVGNAALVAGGTELGPNSLVGVGTVPPPDGVPDGTTWLGSPALRLPVRQSSGSYPEELTYRPTRRAVLARLGIEFFRVTMPASLLATSAYLYLLALSGLARDVGAPVLVLVSPFLAMGAAFAVIAFCMVAKLVVVGRYRPRVEPLWSLFVRRTEFITGLFEAAAVPAGVGALVGTPFLPAVLRMFGARIGRRTWIGTTFLTEFDLVKVGDDVAVGMNVSLQTHLFEDRVMKMSTVTVRSGADIGTRAIVLYDAVVGERVGLGALSLVMKGEHLPPGTSWRGLPAEGVTSRPGPVRGDSSPSTAVRDA
ncbi:amino acid adenylation domain-containing protein [Streptomyces sp. NBC_00846]|uniref:Pls/PosA family non-ribosomal peptide synthetase n=1 Tax=Streptomyces sp. NBC_00846 TaxID=2975849 RepID=UPI00386B9D36|nr:amino acid adenylation domain-containing protein [Streptomyces sp. NBC_00846]